LAENKFGGEGKSVVQEGRKEKGQEERREKTSIKEKRGNGRGVLFSEEPATQAYSYKISKEDTPVRLRACAEKSDLLFQPRGLQHERPNAV